MFLSSVDGRELNPSNTAVDFTVSLPSRVKLWNLEGSRWKVALSDVSISGIHSLSSSVNVMCDIVSSSLIRNSYQPILRSFPAQTLASASLFLPYYMPLNTSSIERIRIYLLDDKLQPLLLPPGESEVVLSCSLHFLRNKD